MTLFKRDRLRQLKFRFRTVAGRYYFGFRFYHRFLQCPVGIIACNSAMARSADVSAGYFLFFRDADGVPARIRLSGA